MESIKIILPLFLGLTFFFATASINALETASPEKLALTKEVRGVFEAVNRLRQGFHLLATDLDSHVNAAAKAVSDAVLVSGRGGIGIYLPEEVLPEERYNTLGITETGRHVAVVRGNDLVEMTKRLAEEPALKKELLAAGATHGGVGMVTDEDGTIVIAVLLIERIIEFKEFSIQGRTGEGPGRKSFGAAGKTRAGKVRLRLIQGGTEKSIETTPSEEGFFSVQLPFFHDAGAYTAEFSILEKENYRVTNRMSLDVK